MLLKTLAATQTRLPQERLATQAFIDLILSDPPPLHKADVLLHKPLFATYYFLFLEKENLFHKRPAVKTSTCWPLVGFMKKNLLCLEDILYMGEKLGLPADHLKFLEKTISAAQQIYAGIKRAP